jgi:hypothetical protein
VCPQGDFDCEFGGYLLALWPPALDDTEAAPMLATRLDARGIRYTRIDLSTRGSTPIAQVTLVPDAEVDAAHHPLTFTLLGTPLCQDAARAVVLGHRGF